MGDVTIQNEWKKMIVDLRKSWGQVTDEEWEKTKGELIAMARVLQQKYGFSEVEATEKIAKFMRKFASKDRQSVEAKLREKLNKKKTH